MSRVSNHDHNRFEKIKLIHSIKNMGFVVDVLLFFIVSLSSVPVYGQDYKNAFNLRSDILTGYDKSIRPLLNQVDIAHVNVTYDIGGIQEINEMSLMSIMVFLLPPDSGERMSYSITLLLALMVFLTIVSDNLPKTSSPLPILSYFIGLHVLLSALITLATILNLRLYYKDEHEPVPSWLCNCCRKRRGGQQYTKEEHLETTKEPASSQGPFTSNRIHLRANLSIPNGAYNRVRETTSYGRYQAENNWQLHRLPGYDQQGTRTTAEAKTELTWKDVSRIADWIMFIMSIVYFVVVFVVFVIIIMIRS